MQMEFSDDFFAGVLRVNISDIPGFNSFAACGDFCCLMINLANCLDPDQARPLSGLIWIQTV